MSLSTALQQKTNDDEGVSYCAVPSAFRSVATEYHQVVPETQGVFWNDDFFDEEDIIAVFDFDYDNIVAFNTPVEFMSQIVTVGFFCLYGTLLFWPYGLIVVLSIYLLSLAPFYLRYNVRWRAEANHLAITRDGIRFVQDRRKSCWGFSMCDKGKHSKTVPFDKITDCDIVEPAGNMCLLFPRILFTVHVDTASSGNEGNQHELDTIGLKDPHRFKNLVWAMKRNFHNLPLSSTQVYQPPNPKHSQLELSDLAQLTKVPSTSSQSSGGVRGLLRDIRDELRQNNELLRNLQHRDETKEVAPVTPADEAIV